MTWIGTRIAAAPRTSSRFMMFEPTALPRLRPPLPRMAAMSETENSGIEVPKPTTVSPTTIGEMPSLRAMREAPSTSHEAPRPRHRMPPVTRSHGRRASKVTMGGIVSL